MSTEDLAVGIGMPRWEARCHSNLNLNKATFSRVTPRLLRSDTRGKHQYEIKYAKRVWTLWEICEGQAQKLWWTNDSDLPVSPDDDWSEEFQLHRIASVGGYLSLEEQTLACKSEGTILVLGRSGVVEQSIEVPMFKHDPLLFCSYSYGPGLPMDVGRSIAELASTSNVIQGVVGDRVLTLSGQWPESSIHKVTDKMSQVYFLKGDHCETITEMQLSRRGKLPEVSFTNGFTELSVAQLAHVAEHKDAGRVLLVSCIDEEIIKTLFDGILTDADGNDIPFEIRASSMEEFLDELGKLIGHDLQQTQLERQVQTSWFPLPIFSVMQQRQRAEGTLRLRVSNSEDLHHVLAPKQTAAPGATRTRSCFRWCL